MNYNAAIADLYRWAEVCEANAPIHASKGDAAQSALSAANAEAYRTAALRLTESQPSVKRWPVRLIAVGVALLAALLAIPAFAATDYEAHAAAVATMDTNAKALAAKRESAEIERQRTLQALAARLDSKDALILGIVESLGARISAGTQQVAQAVQIAAPPQPLPECGFGCYLGKGVTGLFGLARDLAPAAATIWTSKINASVQTATALFNRDVAINGQNTNAAMFSTLGKTGVDISTAGFTANTAIAAAGLARETTVINNSGNQAAIVVGGGNATVAPVTTTTTTTNTTNNTVTCPSTGTGDSNAAPNGYGYAGQGGAPSCTASGK